MSDADSGFLDEEELFKFDYPVCHAWMSLFPVYPPLQIANGLDSDTDTDSTVPTSLSTDPRF